MGLLHEQKKLMGIAPTDPWGLSESVVTTMNKQWQTYGPKVVKAKGKKYTFKRGYTMQVGPNAVQFQYVARKGPDDIMPPKVIFEVSYNRGSDLYDVKVQLFAGSADKMGEREVKGLGFEQFSAFGDGDVLSR
jgi:hypothetical protein